MRPIDADALINRIVFHSDLPGDQKEVFEDEINAEPSIEPERLEGHWIPCSERLPETHAVDVIEVNGEKHVGFRLSKPVLGYAPGMDDEVEIATVWCEEDLDGSTSWITAPDCERVNVIAWMPLPEPYGGNQNE